MRAGRWRIICFALCLISVPSLAASGAWHASASGPALSYRGGWFKSRPLTAPAGISGNITEVSWRYKLTGPAPSGLQVQLCSTQRCTPLEGASGVTHGLAQVEAGETLHMVFGVAGKGTLPPGLRVLSAGVMVNYRQ